MSKTPSLPSRDSHSRGENRYINSADQKQHVIMVIIMYSEIKDFEEIKCSRKKTGKLLEEADFGKNWRQTLVMVGIPCPENSTGKKQDKTHRTGGRAAAAGWLACPKPG